MFGSQASLLVFSMVCACTISSGSNTSFTLLKMKNRVTCPSVSCTCLPVGHCPSGHASTHAYIRHGINKLWSGTQLSYQGLTSSKECKLMVLPYSSNLTRCPVTHRSMDIDCRTQSGGDEGTRPAGSAGKFGGSAAGCAVCHCCKTAALSKGSSQ